MHHATAYPSSETHAQILHCSFCVFPLLFPFSLWLISLGCFCLCFEGSSGIVVWHAAVMMGADGYVAAEAQPLSTIEDGGGGGCVLFVPTKPDLVTGGGAGGTNVKFGWKFSSTCWCNSVASESVGITSRGEGVAETAVSVTPSQPLPPAGAAQTRAVLVIAHSTPLQTTNLSTLVWGTSLLKCTLAGQVRCGCFNTRMSGAN